MLFTVRIYTPFSHKYATKNYHGNMKCSHEIIALGTNTLAELRDKILCNTDVGVCKEVEVPTKEIESASSQAKVSRYSLLTTVVDTAYLQQRL